MVGKGVEPKSSRIFHQCYVKCCKLQNLTPLSSVIPSGNGKVLDCCVDRIKYVDWPPILNALSCDLSLHSVSIRCRQPVKTVLEHIDCERLAKTVNKRAVILTNFMLTNLIEATSQLLAGTTLLTTLLLEGLPLKIPYLNPLCEAILANNSLQHLYLPRCLIGDAGCLAVCKAVRCLPNILTLDLSGCDLTPLGAGYIADLVKYQKIHRYSENWIHTLRYRLPDLDTMAGLRRITVCGNPQLGDVGVAKLLDVLADDLWIKALDAQNCGLTEDSAVNAVKMLQSNTTLVVLDLRHNDLAPAALQAVRAALRPAGTDQQYIWLNTSGSYSDGRSVKCIATKNGVTKERAVTCTKIAPTKYVTKSNVVKKEKEYTEVLEDQLQEEISHRQQLEELNQQLVDQMKQLKQQQIRFWANGANSSGSEHSFQGSSRSGDLSSSSGSTSSVPIDQNTLSYIQQAFKDIYTFIKNNQCHGQCLDESRKVQEPSPEPSAAPVILATKRAQSSHGAILDNNRQNKVTKSAHLLGDTPRTRDVADNNMRPEMIEKQMGDTRCSYVEEPNALDVEDMVALQTKNKKNSVYEKSSPSSSVVSDSSDTLVCSPQVTQRSLPPTHHGQHGQNGQHGQHGQLGHTIPVINPREAFYSSDEDDSS